ncbi:hypothetical protein GIB67_008546 [Kingdonia uniflora]|uniref:C2H2-type domain-containing protein n=1 Tax=Kingdonia uniflora TaxID=39325 RepID=A0A7J7N3R3_9MAGN|nr:hypothetical protein GIB67_008546 [Kingdonia uniflora]
MDKLGCAGDASLQNALDLVYENLNDIPSYGHREALILYSALTTCDPADIMETIQKCKKSKLRCSIIGLSAKIYICNHLCQETGGTYSGIRRGSKTSLRVTCPKCNQHFCFDCDIYIHESLHNFPGCESRRHPKDPES